MIALHQIDHLQVDNCIINTDSKYVKDGITKWITTWKTNNWKTQSNTDVLNKDLWLKFDSLNSDKIEWKWVEGHKDEGNIEADKLAKQGIDCERSDWQLRFISKEKSEVESKNVTQNAKFEKTDIPEQTYLKEINNNTEKGACPLCKTENEGLVMQCFSCKLWCHYRCTKLPLTNCIFLEVPQENLHVRCVSQ